MRAPAHRGAPGDCIPFRSEPEAPGSPPPCSPRLCEGLSREEHACFGTSGSAPHRQACSCPEGKHILTNRAVGGARASREGCKTLRGGNGGSGWFQPIRTAFSRGGWRVTSVSASPRGSVRAARGHLPPLPGRRVPLPLRDPGP